MGVGACWRTRRCGTGEGEGRGRAALHVDDAVVLLGGVVHGLRLPHHHRGVHVHRVRRVLHRRLHLVAEHHLQAANVALGAVGHEDLLRADTAAVQRIGDLGAERADALLGAVPGVRLLGAKVAHASREPCEDVVRHGLRSVADAKADDLGVRVLLEVGVAALADLGEEVASLRPRASTKVSRGSGGSRGLGAQREGRWAARTWSLPMLALRATPLISMRDERPVVSALAPRRPWIATLR